MRDSPGFCQSTHRHAPQGLSASQRAKALTLEPRTGSSGLAHEPVRPRQLRQDPSPLEPFPPEMVRLLERSPSAAAQICQRRRERGLDGGDALGKASGRTVRPRRQAALRTLAGAPGACAQGEWGSSGSVPGGPTPRQRSGLVMALCDSRMLYVAGTVSQTMAHCVACHQHACAFFGGIPHTVMVDNLTAAVLQRALGAAPGWPPTSLACAPHSGVTIAPGHGGKGQATGRVAHGVGDVTKPCRAALASPDCSARHPAARPWRDTVANARVHGAPRDTPTALWHTARPPLRPLPLPPCARAPVAQVRASRPGRMPLATNRSAVPAHYAGHALTRTTSPDRRGLSRDDQRLARQARRDDRCHAVADPEHPTPLGAQRHTARDHQRCRRLLALSPQAEA